METGPGMRLIHRGLDVRPAVQQLEALGALWGEHRERLEREGTAHGETLDLWLRYFARETLREPEDYNRPGECVWYPAWKLLHRLHPIVWALMPTVRAVELGGVLVTRLPAGGRIHRHSDAAAWHARRFNRKAYVVLKANPGCIVECDGVEVVYEEGDIFLLDNLRPHSMANLGDSERMTLIVCMRSDDE